MPGPASGTPYRRLSPFRTVAIAGGLLALPVMLALDGCGPRPDAGSVTPPPPPANTVAGQPGDAEGPFPQRHALARGERDAYAGSQACASCHPREARQQRTHHAYTLSQASAGTGPGFRHPNGVRDPQLGVTYSPETPSGRPTIRASQGGSHERAPVEFAFGSGHRCQTYVGHYEGEPVEFRISYYTGAARWDYTPGHEVGHPVTSPLGRLLAPDRVEACFSCHSTAVVVEQGRTVPDQSLFGVGCESCHGPGRAHIEAVRNNSNDLHMARFATLRSRVTEELCGQCHRTRENVEDPHNAASATSQLPRFQGAALAYSKCFQKSGGRLSCVTCHDPHKDAAETSQAEYNRMCVSCHSAGAAQNKVCRTAPRGDCVSCHMPFQKVDMPTGLRYRNHWIKVWPGGTGSPSGGAASSSDLKKPGGTGH